MKMTWIVADNEHFYPTIKEFHDEASARVAFEAAKLNAKGSTNDGTYLAIVYDMYIPPKEKK